MATDHLWRRGNQWYLRVAIPRPHRHLFISSSGRPMVRVVEKLSDSHEVAKLMAAERVATCMRVFAQCKARIITTLEQAKAALAERRHPDDDLPESWPGFDEAMRRYLAEPPGPRELERRRRANEKIAAAFEAYGDRASAIAAGTEQPAV